MANRKRPLAEAFIRIRAVDGGLDGDIRRMAEPAAEKEGRRSGRRFGQGFSREAGKEVRDGGRQLAREGGEQGRRFGKAFTRDAGKELDKTRAPDLDEGLTRARKAGAEAGRNWSAGFEREADDSFDDLLKGGATSRSAGRHGGAAGRDYGEGFARAAEAEIKQTKYPLTQADVIARAFAGGEGAGRSWSKGFEDGADGTFDDLLTGGTAGGSSRWGRHGSAAGKLFAQGFTRDAKGALRDEDGNFVKESADLGRRWGDGFSKGAGKILGKLKLTDLIKPVGIGVLGASAGASLVNVTTLIGSLGALSGVLGPIPALATSAGIGLGTLALGLRGVGDAIAASGDPKAYAEALALLAPNARSVVGEITKLRPELKGLQQDIQNRMFAGLSDDIQPLAKLYLPLARRELGLIADTFSDTAGASAGALRGIRSYNTVAEILRNGGIFARYMTASLKPLAAALGDVTAVGSSFLPAWGRSMTESLESFSRFTAKVREDGSMKEWMQSGLTAASEVGRVFAGVGAIFAGIFKAADAAGGGTLSSLANVLQGIGAQINSPAFQGGLTSFFETLLTTSDIVVKQVLPPLADALVALEPVLGVLLPAAAVALGDAVSGASDVIVDIAPGLTKMSGLVAELAPYTSELATAFLAVKAAVAVNNFITASTALAGMARAIAGTTAAQWLLNIALTANPIGLVIVAVAALAAGFVLLWQKSETFREIVIGAFKVAGDFILGWISNLLEGFANLLDGLGKIPGPMGEPFRKGGEAVRDLQGKVKDLQRNINNLKGKEVVITLRQTGGIGDASGSLGMSTRAYDEKHRAGGGPVRRFMPYIVGEEGQELFVPETDGTILTAPETRKVLDVGAARTRAARSAAIPEAQPAAGGSTVRLHPDDIAAIAAAIARSMPAPVVTLDGNAISRAVDTTLGRRLA